MTLPLWGSLQKATDDSTTIDEAIAAAIAAHDDDTDAHLGSGQSLESHKTETVIDHPAGSVLADKQTNTEMLIHDTLANLGVWNQVGDVSNSDWPGVNLYIEDGYVSKSEIYLSPQIPSPFLSTAYDSLMQVIVHIDLSNTSYNAWFGNCVWSTGSSAPNDGYGFVINAGTLKAFVVDTGTPSYSTISGYDVTDDHVYRAQLDAVAGTVAFYVDGILEATLDVPGTSWDSDSGPAIGVELTASNDGNMVVADVHFSRSVTN